MSIWAENLVLQFLFLFFCCGFRVRICDASLALLRCCSDLMSVFLVGSWHVNA